MALAEFWYDAEYVKVRLEEAATTLRALPATGCFPASYRSYWPEIVHSAAEAYGWEKAEKPRIVPSGKRIEEMHEALMWLYYILDPRHRKVVFARSARVGTRRLSHEMGLHRNTIGNWFRGGLETIAEALNRR